MKNFTKCHPAVNFVFYISVIIFGVTALHPVMLGSAFLFSLLYSIKLDFKQTVKTLFCFLLPLTAMITAVNGLTAHYGITVLGTLPDGNNLCLEPIIFGLVTGVMASSVIMWFSCFNKNVSSDKIIYLLGGKMPKTAMILTLALRFVPMYKEKLKDIADAQKGFGVGVKDGRPTERIKNGMRIISVLISCMLENSVETADSMKSRGYGLKPKTNYGNYGFTLTDIFLFVAVAVLDIVVAYGMFSGVAYVLYDPFFMVNPPDIGAVTVFASYGLLGLLPFLTDAFYDIRWMKARRRI